jgi:hypothetical protein
VVGYQFLPRMGFLSVGGVGWVVGYQFLPRMGFLSVGGVGWVVGYQFLPRMGFPSVGGVGLMLSRPPGRLRVNHGRMSHERCCSSSVSLGVLL